MIVATQTKAKGYNESAYGFVMPFCYWRTMQKLVKNRSFFSNEKKLLTSWTFCANIKARNEVHESDSEKRIFGKFNSTA